MLGTPLARIAAGGTLGAAFGAAGLWYQLFRRPLPRTSGRLLLHGLEAPVDVLRDRFGVPHVRARTAHDVTFALGFCHGQDRLWQLEFFRRATAGRLSEFAGDDSLPADRLMRTLGMRRAAEREARELPPHVARFATAYVTGINAAIDSARALPIEFQLLRLEPEPWNTVDLLAAAKLIGFGLSTNWEMELVRARIARLAGPERAAKLEPHYPRGNPIVVKPGEPYAGGDNGLIEQIARVRDALGLGMHATGSNNWVVSGERSVTGKPLLACDPHLTFTAPDLWYEADLLCDDYRVRGATLPTNPFHVYGQTDHVAFGFTNVMADTQDLFVERLNADDPRLYEFEGGWREAEIVREEIQVKGRSHAETVDVTVTHHGPIVSDVLGADEPLALAWTGLQYPLLTESGYDLARARNGDDVLEAAASHHVPPLNLLWADRDGNIGYQLAGRIPLRKGGTPDLPKPGWTGEFEWDGTIPYDDLPRVVNPAEGFLVTANNRIVDDDYPHHITSEWMTGYRAQRIEEMLAERERHSVPDFERMQHDFLSLPGIEIVHRLSRLHPTRQREIRAIERLKSWDGVLGPDSVAATIVHAFTVVFAQAIVRAAVGDRELQERWMDKSGAPLFDIVSSPWRFQERLAGALGRGRPGLVRLSRAPGRQELERRRAGGTGAGARRTRGAIRPKPGQVALGPHTRRRVHAPLRRRQPHLQAHLQPLGGGRRRRRDRDPERLSGDGAVQGGVRPRLPDGGRPRRPLALALADYDRAVRAPRVPALRRHDRRVAARPHEPGISGGARDQGRRWCTQPAPRP